MEIQRMDERQFTILTETIREGLENLAKEVEKIRLVMEDQV
jgi:hypothetical protein